MANTLKEKYNLGFDAESPESEFNVDLRPDDYRAFGMDSQVRPSNALIDFWFSNGNQRAISYNHLYDIQYNRSEGLTLTFSEHSVTITGHCLDDLYRGLKRHRIVFVWEAGSQEELVAADDQPVVTKIDIQLRQPPEN